MRYLVRARARARARVRARDLVEGDAGHLDRARVLVLLVVDVAHVDAQPAALRVLLVLDDDRVGVERLVRARVRVRVRVRVSVSVRVMIE